MRPFLNIILAFVFIINILIPAPLSAQLVGYSSSTEGGYIDLIDIDTEFEVSQAMDTLLEIAKEEERKRAQLLEDEGPITANPYRQNDIGRKYLADQKKEAAVREARYAKDLERFMERFRSVKKLAEERNEYYKNRSDYVARHFSRMSESEFNSWQKLRRGEFPPSLQYDPKDKNMVVGMAGFEIVTLPSYTTPDSLLVRKRFMDFVKTPDSFFTVENILDFISPVGGEWNIRHAYSEGLNFSESSVAPQFPSMAIQVSSEVIYLATEYLMQHFPLLEKEIKQSSAEDRDYVLNDVLPKMQQRLLAALDGFRLGALHDEYDIVARGALRLALLRIHQIYKRVGGKDPLMIPSDVIKKAQWEYEATFKDLIGDEAYNTSSTARNQVRAYFDPNGLYAGLVKAIIQEGNDYEDNISHYWTKSGADYDPGMLEGFFVGMWDLANYATGETQKKIKKQEKAAKNKTSEEFYASIWLQSALPFVLEAGSPSDLERFIYALDKVAGDNIKKFYHPTTGVLSAAFGLIEAWFNENEERFKQDAKLAKKTKDFFRVFMKLAFKGHDLGTPLDKLKRADSDEGSYSVAVSIMAFDLLAKLKTTQGPGMKIISSGVSRDFPFKTLYTDNNNKTFATLIAHWYYCPTLGDPWRASSSFENFGLEDPDQLGTLTHNLAVTYATFVNIGYLAHEDRVEPVGKKYYKKDLPNQFGYCTVDVHAGVNRNYQSYRVGKVVGGLLIDSLFWWGISAAIAKGISFVSKGYKMAAGFTKASPAIFKKALRAPSGYKAGVIVREGKNAGRASLQVGKVKEAGAQITALTNEGKVAIESTKDLTKLPAGTQVSIAQPTSNFGENVGTAYLRAGANGKVDYNSVNRLFRSMQTSNGGKFSLRDPRAWTTAPYFPSDIPVREGNLVRFEKALLSDIQQSLQKGELHLWAYSTKTMKAYNLSNRARTALEIPMKDFTNFFVTPRNSLFTRSLTKADITGLNNISRYTPRAAKASTGVGNQIIRGAVEEEAPLFVMELGRKTGYPFVPWVPATRGEGISLLRSMVHEGGWFSSSKPLFNLTKPRLETLDGLMDAAKATEKTWANAYGSHLLKTGQTGNFMPEILNTAFSNSPFVRNLKFFVGWKGLDMGMYPFKSALYDAVRQEKELDVIKEEDKKYASVHKQEKELIDVYGRNTSGPSTIFDAVVSTDIKGSPYNAFFQSEGAAFGLVLGLIKDSHIGPDGLTLFNKSELLPSYFEINKNIWKSNVNFQYAQAEKLLNEGFNNIISTQWMYSMDLYEEGSEEKAYELSSLYDTFIRNGRNLLDDENLSLTDKFTQLSENTYPITSYLIDFEIQHIKARQKEAMDRSDFNMNNLTSQDVQPLLSIYSELLAKLEEWKTTNVSLGTYQTSVYPYITRIQEEIERLRLLNFTKMEQQMNPTYDELYAVSNKIEMLESERKSLLSDDYKDFPNVETLISLYDTAIAQIRELSESSGLDQQTLIQKVKNIEDDLLGKVVPLLQQGEAQVKETEATDSEQK